ncbi:hypothetical protein ENUP19_0365G0013 [Entamoeba nuttalli]|uniref:VWFA domain-containing protein n=1 Tax=Entamoeba nuttalli TaxID=412467 RepID=A0ABQ0DYL7_9EUKA
MNILLIIFLFQCYGLYDFLDNVFSIYKTRFENRNKTRASCSSSCVFDIHGFYQTEEYQPFPLSYLGGPYPLQHPYYCGISCYLKSYNSPMVHYSSYPTQYDNDDICWSKEPPNYFLRIYPKPLFISIHHSNTAIFYPGFQTIQYYNPQDFEYSRGIEFGKSTFFIFYDVSSSNSNFKEKRNGVSLLINSISPLQQVRLVIFNNEARVLQGFMDITHSSIYRMSDNVCQFTTYGGTKPKEPFLLMRDYILEYNLTGNDAHIIFISDMKVYQSKKTLHESIKLLRNRVRQHFNSFQLHMLDSSEDNMGRSDWMKEFACEFDGHYLQYRGNKEQIIQTMQKFIHILKYRMNALPVGTQFPFVKLRDVDYGTFYPSGVAIVKPYYVDVHLIDPLFPLRHAWTFTAVFLPGAIPRSYIGDGDPNYYPSPTIDRVRKYVLDTKIGYQCDSFNEFNSEEQKLIVDSLNGFDYDWRSKTQIRFCPYNRLINESDKTNQTYFCYQTPTCPNIDSFSKQEYNFQIQKTCSSEMSSMLLMLCILFFFY